RSTRAAAVRTLALGVALAHPALGGALALPVLVAGAVAAPRRARSAAPTDTVVEMRAGDRVQLQGIEGRLTIEAWDGDRMEVRTDDQAGPLSVRRSGATVRVAPVDAKGRRRSLDVSVRVPAFVDVEVGGRSLDVVVHGVAGRLTVDNVNGDVWVQDAGGPVEIRTIQGEIVVSGGVGGVTASSQSDDVRLRDVAGPVDVHSGDGDVELMDIRSGAVRVETQDGDIDFSGTVQDGGDYGFFVHDGDATIAIPSDAQVEVRVSTFDGDFESEFPVVLERFTGGREFDFTLGAPRARMEIQVFDGEIRLLRRM
ncbi:MAG: DUF4097 family beta strand repeat-containing protein, partial [Longimicrobiales bacterium]|nr:DUF4097 family beta strand repeat-containing protein [Longimicrobiales bacterium]